MSVRSTGASELPDGMAIHSLRNHGPGQQHQPRVQLFQAQTSSRRSKESLCCAIRSEPSACRLVHSGMKQSYEISAKGICNASFPSEMVRAVEQEPSLNGLPASPSEHSIFLPQTGPVWSVQCPVMSCTLRADLAFSIPLILPGAWVCGCPARIRGCMIKPATMQTYAGEKRRVVSVARSHPLCE